MLRQLFSLRHICRRLFCLAGAGLLCWLPAVSAHGRVTSPADAGLQNPET